MTRAEREEAARKLVCPKCHAEAGRKCKHPNPANPVYHRPMKGVHAERLALVPEGG